MAETSGHREFWSLPTRDYSSDDDLDRNSARPTLDTLFSRFPREHRSLSPSTQSSSRNIRGIHQQTQHPTSEASAIDLRSLDYAVDHDSHLICPICHVPFIDPVVLDCDHTFCASCFSEYRHGATTSGRSQCPSCRTLVIASPRRASRLIYNMCNDIKVRCPNENCEVVVARGNIERHAIRDCSEQLLACPDERCGNKTRRKNYVPGQCVHNTQVECDCGAVIELGQGDWLRHKDELCPNTGSKCGKCGERVSHRDQLSGEHQCRSPDDGQRCPGAEWGCTDEISADYIGDHISSCPFARLAPYLKSQSQLLRTIQNQLADSKLRNEALEIDLERMGSLIENQIQPRLDHLSHGPNTSDTHTDDHSHDHDNDIEEIPRDNIPSAAAIHHRDLLLPAHVRDLTPSPDLSSASNPHAYLHNQAHMHNHLLSMHESLRHTVGTLEADVNSLHHALAELDARMSMQIMNETLRIKEDLAYTHAALMSNRSQVQWLLNRERMGREQAILRERGRAEGQVQQHQVQAGAEIERPGFSLASPGNGTHQPHIQPETFPFPSTGAGMSRTHSGSAGGSATSSTATSPMVSVIGLAGTTRRPSIRGGSQERVKL